MLILILLALAHPSQLGPAITAFPDLKPPNLGRPGVAFDGAKYEEEFAALVFADILPNLPQTCSVLQKLQYEQVRAGISALHMYRHAIRVCRWDVADDNDYLALAAELHKVAADLHTTPVGKVRCYEARVILLKEFERYTNIRIDTGNLSPAKRGMVQFARLQAETDLLKLADSHKAAK